MDIDTVQKLLSSGLTWGNLVASGVALGLTKFAVDAAKRLFQVTDRGTLITAFIVAEVLTILSVVFTVGHSPNDLGLAVVKGLLIAWAATGFHETVKAVQGK